MRALLFALGLLAGVAWAADWDVVSVSAEGAEWRMRRGSLTLAGTSLSADFVRDHGGKPVSYRVIANSAQCDNDAGDVTLLDADGKHIGAAMWRNTDQTVGRALAAALCNALRRTKK